MGRVCARRHFIRKLTGTFPHIAASISEYSRGLLHCEMAEFARATQKALDSGDYASIEAHFKFAEELWQVAGVALENALTVSYLENIDFDKTYPMNRPARNMLSPSLRTGLSELEDHSRRLGSLTKRESSSE